MDNLYDKKKSAVTKAVRHFVYGKLFVLFLIVVFLVMVVSLLGGVVSTSNKKEDSTVGFRYVTHWTGDDAYSHNITAHRYGITAEQLDGFLDSTGISYDKNRINGTKLLEWEKKSGLDVRAIVAIAQMESSYGTAGVATQKGANMFGYGAYDSNPNHATNYNDETAVVQLTTYTIIQNKNTSFKIQDEKAKKLAENKLNVAVEGNVYFTDTSGTGKKRAEVMEKLDKWIDDHGGTPQAPDGGSLLDSFDLPPEYIGKFEQSKIGLITQAGSGYPQGQCTWYAYNRMVELGKFDTSGGYGYLGNGGDWVKSLAQKGWKVSTAPIVGAIVSVAPGTGGSDPAYGHVAVVEYVNSDGSFLISECNVAGVMDKIHYAVWKLGAGHSFAIKE